MKQKSNSVNAMLVIAIIWITLHTCLYLVVIYYIVHQAQTFTIHWRPSI